MIEGFRVGHSSDFENVTGCTVVLAPSKGAIGGVDVRGPAPGTLGTETLGTGRAIERVHAIVLSGGSAFGLASVAGVMRYLAEKEIGFQLGAARVPIAAGAILFDLMIGNPKAYPKEQDGYQACLNASETFEEGSVGAGTGATIGKLQGNEYSTKGGIGYAERKLRDDIRVGVLAAVNAVGDVVDATNGQIIAGMRSPEGGWRDSGRFVLEEMDFHEARETREPTNTTIGVVMTDATLDVEEANLIASMAHDGIARATRPSHTFTDGDTLFVLASGTKGEVNPTVLGHAAAVCVSEAIVRAVKLAKAYGGVKQWDE